MYNEGERSVMVMKKGFTFILALVMAFCMGTVGASAKSAVLPAKITESRSGKTCTYTYNSKSKTLRVKGNKFGEDCLLPLQYTTNKNIQNAVAMFGLNQDFNNPIFFIFGNEAIRAGKVKKVIYYTKDRGQMTFTFTVKNGLVTKCNNSYPSAITYKYDKKKRLTGISAAWFNYTFRYNSKGQMNGVTVKQKDARLVSAKFKNGRVTSMEGQMGTDGANSTNRTYTYNSNGRLSRVKYEIVYTNYPEEVAFVKNATVNWKYGSNGPTRITGNTMDKNATKVDYRVTY